MPARCSLSGRLPLRLARLSLCICIVAALFASAALAQIAAPPQADVKLASVTAAGSQNYSSEVVAQLSRLVIGEPVNRDAIQAGANRLAATGLFSSVNYRFDTTTAGVQVTFNLQDAPAYPISFDNFPWFTDDELFRALKQAGIPLQAAAPGSGSILDAMDQALEKTLATRSVQARVTHELTLRPDTGQKIVEFSVSGAGMNIAAIQFSDPLAANDKSLQSAASSLIGKPFSREAIQLFLFKQVRPIYLSRAYLKVHFGIPEARLSGNPQDPRSLKVVAYVPIDAGEPYNWGGVTWSGSTVFSIADLNNLPATEGLVAGQPANGQQIQNLWQSLLHAYQHRGYLDAKIEPTVDVNDSTHIASYHAAISEGVQYHMGNLVLSGLSPESDQRIRRAWKIPAGQTFDLAYYDDFLSNGIALALKGTPAVRDTIGRYLQKNPGKATVDVMLDFQ